MKTIAKTLHTIIFILCISHSIPAQTKAIELNQVELMKQFIGSWKGDLGNSSVFICDNKAFSNGILSNSQVIINGEIIESVVQLYGYDVTSDKFIIAELKESTTHIELCSIWFTSKNTGEIIITNPDDAPYRFRFEFKNQDTIIQTAIQDDKVMNKIVLNRVEPIK